MRFTVRQCCAFTIFAAALFAAVLPACSRPENQSGGGGADATSLTIKGSDTMVHLVTVWSEAYMAAKPESSVAVTGGGSGNGIAAIINGSTDICMSSRNIKEEEQKLAEEKGLLLEETVVGRDGIAIAVHPENPVSSLTMDQLEKIFTGAYTRWSEVGGPDQAITLLSRESSSGTYVFFQEHVLNKKDFPAHARLMTSTTAIVQALQTDQWSIGYIGLGYAAEAADSVKVIGVAKEEGAQPVVPNNENVLSGEYPISRTLLFYTPQQKNALVQDFIAFCLSPEGQETVVEAGYVPVN